MIDPRRAVRLPSVIGLVLVALLPASLLGQQKWQWPDEPENLQVLPKNFDGRRLRAVMTGFTRALGVRCSHCHVGEEGQPLSTYDFASDENPKKDTTREMLRMLDDINAHLAKIDPSGTERVNMWCHTCHRGRPRPMTLAEELSEKFQLEGIDATVAHYRKLRREFYGRGSYDFGEESLNRLGYQLLATDHIEPAIAIFALNVKQFPASANVYDSLAEAYMKNGDNALAIQNYRKSLDIDSDNKNAREQLRKLEGKD